MTLSATAVPYLLAGGPWVVPTASGGGAASAPPSLAPRGSLRHRWPSITCSQDLGGIGAPPSVSASVSLLSGDPFALVPLSEPTLGTMGSGDRFWDAGEAFGSGGSGSSGKWD